MWIFGMYKILIVAILIEIIKTIILSVHFNCFHFCKNVIYAYCSARESGRKIDVKWLFHGFECNNKMYINLIVSIYDCVYIPVLWISVNEKKESKFSSMVIVKLLRHIQCEIGLIWTDKRTHTHHALFIYRIDCLTIRYTVLINYLKHLWCNEYPLSHASDRAAFTQSIPVYIWIYIACI